VQFGDFVVPSIPFGFGNKTLVEDDFVLVSLVVGSQIFLFDIFPHWHNEKHRTFIAGIGISKR
jgi:hypothetical protein